MLIPLLTTLVAGLTFWKLTATAELKAGRWVKIGVSLPIVWFIAATLSQVELDFSSGRNTIVLGVALVFLWRGNIAHLIGQQVSLFFYGDGRHSACPIPNYKFAHEKALEGELDKALKLCQGELSKQPDDFEGLFLLATIHMEMKQPKLALEQVELILKIPRLTDAQKRDAMNARAECMNAIH